MCRSIEACCAPLLAGPLDEQLGRRSWPPPSRRWPTPSGCSSCRSIAAAPDGTACSCDLEEPVGKSQPTVSHHLAVLADAGLITKEKVGRWVYCSVVPERLAVLRGILSAGAPA